MKRIWIDDIQQWDGKTLLSVIGPTASGKTGSTLLEIERRFPKDLKYPLLVSVDSVAVYAGLDIGSAKPMGRERSDFDWVGLDLALPDRTVTASDYVAAVLPAIEAAIQAGRPVVCVGGSLFYERALMEGMAPGASSDSEYQKGLEPESNARLKERLLALDTRWDKIHQNDRYRLTRYLDLTERQGFSFDDLHRSRTPRPWTQLYTWVVGLDADLEDNRDRMWARISEMLAAGWIEETRSLKKKYGIHAPALESVGYREIVAFLQEKLSLPELEEQILISHMQLAKKQRSWLRGMRESGDTID